MKKQNTKPTKRLLTNILRIVITVGALAFLFWQIDPRQTFEELRTMALPYWLLGFLLYGLSLVIRAYRWHVLIRSLNPDVPFGRLVHLYFVGQFFSTFLPSSYGGDVVRALELTQDTDTSAAVGTVLLDRMSGLMMLALQGLLLLPFQAALMPTWLVWTLIVISSGILVAGGLVLEGRLLQKITARLPFGLSLAGEGPLAKVYAAITGCGWRAVLGAFGVSIVFNIINVVINWLCGQAMRTGIGLTYFFVVTPLLSISGLVPSVGGWGVREAVSSALFSSVGEEKAVAVGVALGLIMLGNGLLGGLVYLVESLYKMIAKRNEEQENDHAP